MYIISQQISKMTILEYLSLEYSALAVWKINKAMIVES